MGDVRDTLEVVKGRTDKLDLMKEQLRDCVVEIFSANRDVIKEALHAVRGDQTKKNDTLEAMVIR